MAAPSDLEQYILELINTARADPEAEAARLGIDLNENLLPGTIDGTPKQPLAIDPALIDSSREHTAWMLATDSFSHTGAGGSSGGERMDVAGYGFTGSWGWGENLAWVGSTAGVTDSQREINAAQLHDNLFVSPSHRTNLMNGTFESIGLGEAVGEFSLGGVPYNASMLTENFAYNDTGPYLTGVVYTDTDGDGFYSPGEGAGGVPIAAGIQAETWDSGGYSLDVGTGIQEVVFGGGTQGLLVRVAQENVKIDLVNGDTIVTTGEVLLLGGISNVVHMGLYGGNSVGDASDNRMTGGAGNDEFIGINGQDTLEGGAGDDTLDGGSGDDEIYGGSGTDRAVFPEPAANYSAVATSGGLLISGAATGTDFIADDVEILAFSDGTLSFAEALQLNGGGGPTPEPDQDPTPEPEPEPEPEPVLPDSIAATVGENTAPGTQVLRLPEIEGFTYQLTAGDTTGAQMFGLEGGVIVVAEGAQLDHEAAALMSLNVDVFDAGGGLVDTLPVEISVLDVPGATVTGTEAANNLVGTEEEDQISGLGGDDVIEGLGGVDVIDGGAGSDTAVYRVTRAEADVTAAPDGTLSVTDASGATDSLTGIERVDLLDGDLLFGIESANLAAAYRLYAAAFVRTPDAGGLVFWIGELDAGADFGEVADIFVNSPEFIEKYGTDLSSTEYVTQLYDNVLGRAPDQDGLEFWVDAFEAGVPRGDLLEVFANSDENIARTEPDLEAGVWVLNG